MLKLISDLYNYIIFVVYVIALFRSSAS